MLEANSNYSVLVFHAMLSKNKSGVFLERQEEFHKTITEAVE
jgi:hypothetical protein